MAQVNVGRMTEEECFDLARELIPNIREEHLFTLLDDIAEQVTWAELQAYAQQKAEKE